MVHLLINDYIEIYAKPHIKPKKWVDYIFYRNSEIPLKIMYVAYHACDIANMYMYIHD